MVGVRIVNLGHPHQIAHYNLIVVVDFEPINEMRIG